MHPNRLAGADFVRACACLMVLAHHLLQRLDYGILPGGWRPFFDFALIGSFGVSVFFVLSGYLLSRPFWLALDRGEAMPSLLTYAWRRAARILPGFWLALTVTFVLSFTLFAVSLDGLLVQRYLAGMFLISDWHWNWLFPVEYNGPLWSIGFEITSYALLPLGLFALFLWRAPQRWQSRLIWLGVIALTLFVHWLALQYWPVDPVRRGWRYGLIGGAKEWMPRFNPFGFFAIFAIGALTAGVQVWWGRHRHWLFDVLALVGFAITLLAMASHAGRPPEGWGLLSIPYDFPVFPLAIGLMLAALPSSVFVGQMVDNRFFGYLATISFGIYVWHFLVLELVRVFWFPSFFHGGVGSFPTWLMGSAVIVAITLVVATLSWRYFESPILNWARDREQRRKPVLVPA